jgi:hypothetical protein
MYYRAAVIPAKGRGMAAGAQPSPFALALLVRV